MRAMIYIFFPWYESSAKDQRFKFAIALFQKIAPFVKPSEINVVATCETILRCAKKKKKEDHIRQSKPRRSR